MYSLAFLGFHKKSVFVVYNSVIQSYFSFVYFNTFLWHGIFFVAFFRLLEDENELL